METSQKVGFSTNKPALKSETGIPTLICRFQVFRQMKSLDEVHWIYKYKILLDPILLNSEVLQA